MHATCLAKCLMHLLQGRVCKLLTGYPTGVKKVNMNTQ